MGTEEGELLAELGIDTREDRLGPFGQFFDRAERIERSAAERVNRDVPRTERLDPEPPVSALPGSGGPAGRRPARWPTGTRRLR